MSTPDSREKALLLRARECIYDWCDTCDFMSDEDAELLDDIDARILAIDPTYVAKVPQ